MLLDSTLAILCRTQTQQAQQEFLLHTIRTSEGGSEVASFHIIQNLTEWRTFTIPHFSTISNREGEAYPQLAMRRVLKECSVHSALSLCAFEHRAAGGQSQPLFASVIALWLCTVLNGSVKTMWKSPQACMNSASFGGTRPSLEQWGIFPILVGPKQKENAQANAPKASSSD